jgi:hypothetical protein
MDFISVDDIVGFLCKKPAFARSVMEKLKMKYEDDTLVHNQKQNQTAVKPEAKPRDEPEAKPRDEPEAKPKVTREAKAEVKPIKPKANTQEAQNKPFNLSLCLAKVKNGCQCSRKPKSGTLFCGLHKTQKFGCVVEIKDGKAVIDQHELQNVEINNQSTPNVNEEPKKVPRKTPNSVPNKPKAPTKTNKEEKTEENVDDVNISTQTSQPKDEPESETLDCADARDILLDVMLEQGICHNIKTKLKPDFKNEVYDDLNDSDNEDEEEDEYEDIDI